jgi:hypothetical protein
MRLKASNSIERIQDTLHNHSLQSYLPDGETVKTALKHALGSRSQLVSPNNSHHQRNKSRVSNSTIGLSNISPKKSFLPGLH